MSQPDNVTPVGALAPVGTRTPVDALIPAEAQTLVDGLTSAEVPAPPDEVAEVFGVATASAIAYAGILATRGVEWGVIGQHLHAESGDYFRKWI